MSTIGRAPKDYNSGAWGRILARIDKTVNNLANRIGAGESATRQLQATQREQRSALASMLTPEATFEWSEYVDPSTERVYGQCIIEVTRGWAIISDFEYREGDGNIDSLTAWTSYKSGPNMSFVPSSSYKGGGYYLYRKELPFIKGDDRVSLVSVELRGKGADGDVWLQSSHTFDGNKVPQFRSEPKLVLQWDTATSEWNVIAIGEADDDTQSVAFYVSDNTQLSGIDGFSPSNFSTAVTNFAGSDKTFKVSLGYFPPSTKDTGPRQLPRTLYVAAGAFDGVDATPSNPDAEFASVLLSIDIPVSPTAAGILKDGDVTANFLADTAKRASVNLTVQHKTGAESSTVTVSGTIAYIGDASAYTIPSQDIVFDTTGVGPTKLKGDLTYIYFDPSVSTNQLQIAVATGSETAKEVATKISGKRIFVGIGSAAYVERAFFVFTNDQPVFSAPFIFASKLEALVARMGTLIAGSASFKIGDSVSGTAPNENDGIFINDYNYWYDTGNFGIGNANRKILWDGSALSINIDGNITVDDNGIRILSQSGNVDKIRWVNGVGSSVAEIYTGGAAALTISAAGLSIGLLSNNVKINKGVALFADINTPSTEAAGQSFFTTMYSLGGDFYKRGGTSTAYKILDASDFPITANNGDTLYYNSGWQKLAKGLDGEVLTLASGLPTWAAAGGGGSYQPLDSDLTAIAALTPTTGQIIFAQSGSWTSLPIGTAGTFLKSSFGTPSWTSIVEADISNLGTNIVLNSDIGSTVQAYSANLTSLASDPLTATTAASTYQPLDDALSDIAGISTSQGDLLYGLATNNGWTKLPIGSAGTFLKSSFGSPSWSSITESDISDLGTTIVLDSDIGSAVQAYSASLTSLAADPLTATTAASTYQPLDTNLTQIANITPSNGGIIIFSGGSYAQLPAGTNEYILQMSFGTPSWSALSGIDVGDLNDDGTYLDAASGQTITFNDTEFQTVDGGTQTEYRQRTITVTNGQITSVGTFGSWVAVVVN